MLHLIKAVVIAAMILAGLMALVAIIPFLLYGGGFVIIVVVIYFMTGDGRTKKPP